MPEGTIMKLTDKGFGFIHINDGQDILFHTSNLAGLKYSELYVGLRVSFTESRNSKGPRAENVRPISFVTPDRIQEPAVGMETGNHAQGDPKPEVSGME